MEWVLLSSVSGLGWKFHNVLSGKIVAANFCSRYAVEVGHLCKYESRIVSIILLLNGDGYKRVCVLVYTCIPA